MLGYDLFNDGKSYTGPLEILCVMQTLENVEYCSNKLHIKSDAVVFDKVDVILSIGNRTYGYAGFYSFSRKLDCI